MAEKALNKEIEEWFEEIPDELQESFIELVELTKDNIQFTIGENEMTFTITYPKDYPQNKEERFFILAEDSSLSEWQQGLNDWADKPRVKISELLNEAAERFVKIFNDGKDEEEQNEDMGLEEEEPVKRKPKKSQAEMEIDKKMENRGFLEVGSPQATLRLISDLKNLRKQKKEELGFTADPVVDQKSGLENLYHWHIKLDSIDDKSDLYKDMQVYQKKTGMDFILLEMRFSKDYPHVPPFVRVVRPRFLFRTGHVTLGGSICMELLTISGWNATNDIESILIQIIAELLSGGARLDSGMGNNFEYSEHEAWDAFYRAARTHGWDINGLGKDMFPRG